MFGPRYLPLVGSPRGLCLHCPAGRGVIWGGRLPGAVGKLLAKTFYWFYVCVCLPCPQLPPLLAAQATFVQQTRAVEKGNNPDTPALGWNVDWKHFS